MFDLLPPGVGPYGLPSAVLRHLAMALIHHSVILLLLTAEEIIFPIQNPNSFAALAKRFRLIVIISSVPKPIETLITHFRSSMGTPDDLFGRSRLPYSSHL